MTEQELKEKMDNVIAEILRDVSGIDAYRYYTDKILALIGEALPELAKEAGYSNETDAISYSQGVLDGRKS